VLDIPLEDYVTELEQRVGALAVEAAG